MHVNLEAILIFVKELSCHQVFNGMTGGFETGYLVRTGSASYFFITEVMKFTGNVFQAKCTCFQGDPKFAGF